ncbi:hypothetical protein MAIC_11630 [Mycolicibacterium aichiense]|uniref:Uncharacterized protein n=1 Tax=Mycolicibacterium aichiense TaxID=1799 RepID=A0AAD1MBA7_9MYCO|nr:hypothetical protein MAIC_11630 [Mycolicibacterium aichiense]
MVVGVRAADQRNILRRCPFGVTVGELTGGPAVVFDQEVVAFAGQGEIVDVGAAAVFPIFGRVVDVAVVAVDGAAGCGAATVFGQQHDSLVCRRQSLAATEPQ